MNKNSILISIRVNTYKLFWILFFAATAFFINTQLTFAQSPSPVSEVNKFNIIFPIAELGNCQDVSSCRNYCEDLANKEACINFAKQKGFYKEPNQRLKDLALAAKTELGCDSKEACRSFCQDQTNFDKCQTFAKSHNIKTHSNPQSSEVIKKAQEALGCDSKESCKAICELEENKDECSVFAKQVNLRGGVEKRGPGGCDSQETCQAFCSSADNFEECQRRGGGQGGQFKGPGGCSSKDECENFCKDNPESCQGKEQIKNKFLEHRLMNLDLEQKCKTNPEECKKILEGRKEFQQNKNERLKECQEHPEKCRGNLESTPSGSINKENRGFGGANNFDKEKFCQENPQRCKGNGPVGPNNQNFEQKEPRNVNTQGYNPFPNNSPKSPLPQNSNTTINEEVKGVSTTKGFFQRFIDYLF